MAKFLTFFGLIALAGFVGCAIAIGTADTEINPKVVLGAICTPVACLLSFLGAITCKKVGWR